MTSRHERDLHSFVFIGALCRIVGVLAVEGRGFESSRVGIVLSKLIPRGRLMEGVRGTVSFDFVCSGMGSLCSPLKTPDVSPIILVGVILVRCLFNVPSVERAVERVRMGMTCE